MELKLFRMHKRNRKPNEKMRGILTGRWPKYGWKNVNWRKLYNFG